MKIYVIRHGQTNWNIEGKMQGQTDIPLNESGIKQAKEAKKELDNYAIDFVFYSPLSRTKQTMELLLEGRNVKKIEEKALKERYFGKLEGSIPEEHSILKDGRFYGYYENLRYEDAETVQELFKRVWDFLDKIVKKYSDKNILLVTHGGTIKAIRAYFEGIPENGIVLPKHKNCQIGVFEYNKKEEMKSGN